MKKVWTISGCLVVIAFSAFILGIMHTLEELDRAHV